MQPHTGMNEAASFHSYNGSYILYPTIQLNLTFWEIFPRISIVY